MKEVIDTLVEHRMESLFWLLLIVAIAVFYYVCWRNVMQSKSGK